MNTTHSAIPRDKPILLFDGVCNLCNSSVQWVIEHDPEGKFRFASLQSDVGQALLTEFNLDPAALNTVVLIDEGKAFTHSAAPLQVAKHLGSAWALLGNVGLIVPRPIRDGIYNFIAANRYRWFGKKDQCWLPTPDLRQRFLNN